jgi:hypothetical protein
MKKFLCTASLILAFSMGSFANTNETNLKNVSNASTVAHETKIADVKEAKILSGVSLFATDKRSVKVIANSTFSSGTTTLIEDCYVVKVQVRWLEVSGPEDDPNSYTLRYQNYTIIICFD